MEYFLINLCKRLVAASSHRPGRTPGTITCIRTNKTVEERRNGLVLGWQSGGRHRRRQHGDEHTGRLKGEQLALLHLLLLSGKAQNYSRTNTWLISARTSMLHQGLQPSAADLRGHRRTGT